MHKEPPMAMAMAMDREDDPNPKDSDPLLAKKADDEEAEASKEASSGEITKDEEIESSSAACCRICLEYDSEPAGRMKGNFSVVIAATSEVSFVGEMLNLMQYSSILEPDITRYLHTCVKELWP